MYRCLQSHSMQLHCMDHLYFCMKYWEFCVSLLTPEIFNILFWNRIKRPIWLINCMCPVLLFDCLTVQIFCRLQLRRDTNMKWQRCRDTITETVTSVFGECCCLSALTGQICIKLLSVPSFLVSYFVVFVWCRSSDKLPNLKRWRMEDFIIVMTTRTKSRWLMIWISKDPDIKNECSFYNLYILENIHNNHSLDYLSCSVNSVALNIKNWLKLGGK